MSLLTMTSLKFFGSLHPHAVRMVHLRVNTQPRVERNSSRASPRYTANAISLIHPPAARS
jgi:hypothetical protein